MENYLNHIGLMWKSLEGGRTLQECFERAKAVVPADRTDLERLNFVLQEEGTLTISQPETFSSYFGVYNIREVPLELLEICEIKPYLEVDDEIDQSTVGSFDDIYTKYVYANWSEKRLNELMEGENDSLRERYVEGYPIKKIFQKHQVEEYFRETVISELIRCEETITHSLEEEADEIFGGLLSMCLKQMENE